MQKPSSQNDQQISPKQQPIAVYWFRNDLRLSDNPVLSFACQQCIQQGYQLALVFCLPAEEQTRWGFERVGSHRKAYLADTLRDLATQCALLGHRLILMAGDPSTLLPEFMRKLGATRLYCEEIAAPEEINQLRSLQRQAILVNGFQIFSQWQSSLLQPTELPVAIDQLPLVFTSFRYLVEKAGCRPKPPLPPLSHLPLMPEQAAAIDGIDLDHWAGQAAADARSALPYQQSFAKGGETAAQRHLQQYFQSTLPRIYKETRNGLIGFEYSTKFSPWLATGAISARQIYQQLTAHEAEYGQNDSTYWIWFELLWRDYFRFLHLRFGRQLYHAHGLKTLDQKTAQHSTSKNNPIPHQPENFQRWCLGNLGQPSNHATGNSGQPSNHATGNSGQPSNHATGNSGQPSNHAAGNSGQAFINAGMRELASTGYLSNRMRQIVASYLVNDLQCDWRAGAAWFESQLIDYDVYSNQGNWLYLAGYGTDPRSNRRFNLEKQQQTYDPLHAYIKLWCE